MEFRETDAFTTLVMPRVDDLGSGDVTLRPKPRTSVLPRRMPRLPRVTIARGAQALAEGPDAPDLALVDVLGEGGMGRVLEVRQRSLGRTVAAKVPRPGASNSVDAAIVREAEIAGQLEHPNIVPVHQLGVDEEGRPVLVMKRIAGTPWSELLDHPGLLADFPTLPRVPLDASIRVLLSVCDALSFAHARGIVHRDLKPENVMVGAFGEVYLLDWGLALDVSAGPVAAEELVGTPCFLPPEHLDPSMTIGPHTDVFLLGASLATALTGRPLYAGESVFEILGAAHTCAPPELPDEAPEDLAALCRAAVSRDPDGRPSSVLAFRAALEAHLAHRPARTLLVEAERALADLVSALDAGDVEGARRAAAEAEFSLRRAFVEWPSFEAAGATERRLRLASARLALALEHEDEARARIAELPASERAALEPALAALVTTLASRRRAARALERLRTAHDIEVNARTRAAIVATSAGIAVVAWAIAQGIERRVGIPHLDTPTLFLVHVVTLVGTVIGLFLLRRPLFSNAANGRAVFILLGVLIAIFVNRVLALEAGTPPSVMLGVDLLMFALGIYCAAVTVARPWALASLFGICAAYAAVRFPAHAEAWFAFGVGTMMTYAALVFRPVWPHIRLGLLRYDATDDDA